jgi:Ala-tRNA(Pro) deacylase
MAMAITLREYLDELKIHYDVVKHAPTNTSMETAAVAHVPGDKLVKSVLLKDDQDYLMAVVPSTYHVQLSDLPTKFNRHTMDLVPEDEIASIFTDCEVGAIPPIGHAYAIDMIVDNKLFNYDDVYIEAGDHVSLLHINNRDFRKLVSNSPIGEFTRHI